MRASSWVRCFCGWLCIPLAAWGQAFAPLRNGQRVTLQGVLTMEPRARLQFVTVTSKAGFVVSFGEDRGSQRTEETVHEIGLAGYRDYPLLYGHRGQTATVTGKLLTDNATPSFFDGTRLDASSIRAANGAELLGSPAGNDAIAADVGTYTAEVVLPANGAMPWQYRVHGQPVREGRFLACSSNGAGDVLNCSCARGFRATAAQSLIKGRASAGEILEDLGSAQFEAGKKGQFPEQKLTVTCGR